jgi:serine/threonine protein kinase
VAIKILAKSKTGFAQLNAELQVMADIDHINIMKFIECFEGAKCRENVVCVCCLADENSAPAAGTDEWFVVMELVEGGELFDRIVTMGTYNEGQAQLVVRQVRFF